MKTLRALEKHPWIFLLAIALLGVVLDLVVVRHGVGASGDSVWYMQGAENILKGYGYGIVRGDGFVPITMFPPFYSIVLAGIGAFGGSIFRLAGILNALLFGANIALAGLLVLKLTKSPAASILASLFVMLAIDLFLLHTWAMTEPLFITLALSSLAFAWQYQQKGQRRYLALAGLAAGLSVVTRYVGVSLVATLCLWMLFFGKGRLTGRIKDTLLLAGLGALPLAILLVRNSALGDSAIGRSEVLARLIPAQYFTGMKLTITSWFFPGLAYRIPAGFLTVVFVGLAILSAALFLFSVIYRSKEADEEQRLFTRFEILVALFLAIYVLTFILSIQLSLTGSATDWTEVQFSRYLIPAFPFFVLIAALTGFRVHRALRGKKRLYGGLAIAAVAILLALYGFAFYRLQGKHISLGYTDIRNRYPALVAELQSLGPTRPIVSNNYELASFLSGRPVYSIPGQGNEITGVANPEYPRLMENIMNLIDQDAVVVIYHTNPDEIHTYDSLVQDLNPLSTYGDGQMSISLYSQQDR